MHVARVYWPRKPVSRAKRAGLRGSAAMSNFRPKWPSGDIELSECRMPELKADVVVLGAGMVGVGAALHLQQRGRDVMLVDRHGVAGEETSYGNAGLIECASVFPYMFPWYFGLLLKYALNRVPNVR